MATEGNPAHSVLSTRWRRVLAFVVDYFAIVLICWSVALVLKDTIVSLGDWARIVGFAIVAAYFAVLDSSMLDGRSPGKRLLGIRVVDGSGQPPSMARAAVRAGVIAIPFSLNGLFIPGTAKNAALLGVLVFLCLFGLGLALLYLFLFNRNTRQSLHEWLTGTFTVRGRPEFDATQLPGIWRPHLAIAGALLLLGAVLPLMGMQYARTLGPEWADLKELQRASALVQRHPEVVGASVSHWQEADGRQYFLINARIKNDPSGKRPLADSLVEQMRNEIPRTTRDPVVAQFSHGWSMGVWGVMTTHSYGFD